MPGRFGSVRSAARAVGGAAVKLREVTRQLARSPGEAETALQRVIAAVVAQRAQDASWDAVYPGLTVEERARARIRRALEHGTVAAVLAAGGATAAQAASAGSEGWAAPIALPLGIASIGADVLYTTILQVELALELASLYGVPFDDDDVGELATLLALPLGVALPEEHTPGPWQSITRMYHPDLTEVVGGKLLRRGVIRTVLPVAGIVVSAIDSQMQLRRYALHLLAAVRHRAAVARACRRLGPGSDEARRTILDGAWLLATGCGPVGPEVALALSMLIDTMRVEPHGEADEAFVEPDVDAWLAQAAALDASAKDALIDVLVVVASADGRLKPYERRFLQRVGRAIGREVDLADVVRECARLRAGEVGARRTGVGVEEAGMGEVVAPV